MAESYNLLENVTSFDVSPEQSGYSKVRINTGRQYSEDDPEVDAGIANVGDPIFYEKGDDTGRVLEITNEWGTQQMADDIYKDVSGWQYQPYEADGARLDPAAELSDGVTIDGVYGGVYIRATDYSTSMSCHIAAPSDTELEHEFNLEAVTDRTYTRFLRATKSELSIMATKISAKVESKSGDETKAFGWDLTDSSWTIWSKTPGNEIIKADETGLTVKGVIRATSGYIGGSSGFTIETNKIYNGMKTLKSSSDGVYIGTDGIALGGGNFKVESSGSLTAKSGTFGSLSVSNGTSTYNGGLSLCTGSLSTSINVGTEGIDTYVGNIVAGKVTASYITSKITSTSSITTGSLTVGGSEKQLLINKGTTFRVYENNTLRTVKVGYINGQACLICT